MQYEKFFSLSEKNFYIETLDVYNGHPIPPSNTVCKVGDMVMSRFFYVVSGAIVFNGDTDKYLRASAGDIIYLPTNVTYTSYWEDNPDSEYITFNCNMFDVNHEEILLADDIMIICNDHDKKYYDIFRKMDEVYFTGMINWELSLKSYFFAFLAETIYQLSYNELKNSALPSVIYRGIVYLENNYMLNVSIKELADKCNVSETTFRRNFMKLKGMSPVSYRNELRLQHAFDFLKSGLYSINEVVSLVGFNDIPYFSKSFKKKYGITPAECMRKGKNRQFTV